MPEFDFGFGSDNSSVEQTTEVKPGEDVTNIETGKVENNVNGGEAEDITDNGIQQQETTEVNNNEENNDTKSEYEEGTVIEFDNNQYTVDNKGNLIDKNGNVFKEAKDVKAWIDSLDVEKDTESNDSNILDIKSIQEAIGVEIVGEDETPIEFENTPEGVRNYVQSVIENSRQQIVNSTIDALYDKYPILENVINYYVANGNSLEGFNELKDRSRIELDINNEAQCEAIIREAWKEDGRKGNVDSYIMYLKSQDLLGSTAQEELEGLIEKDKNSQELLAKQAEEQEAKLEQERIQYWTKIKDITTVNKRIGKYQIPDTIIRSRDGQKTSATPVDFFNYVYQVDKHGRSAYENDLIREMQENPEARVVNDLLAAYLKFTGGDYQSLVNMAINEQKVNTIKLKSKTAPKSKAKVTPPAKNNKNKSVDLGY